MILSYLEDKPDSFLMQSRLVVGDLPHHCSVVRESGPVHSFMHSYKLCEENEHKYSITGSRGSRLSRPPSKRKLLDAPDKLNWAHLGIFHAVLRRPTSIYNWGWAKLGFGSISPWPPSCTCSFGVRGWSGHQSSRRHFPLIYYSSFALHKNTQSTNPGARNRRFISGGGFVCECLELVAPVR